MAYNKISEKELVRTFNSLYLIARFVGMAQRLVTKIKLLISSLVKFNNAK